MPNRRRDQLNIRVMYTDITTICDTIIDTLKYPKLASKSNLEKNSSNSTTDFNVYDCFIIPLGYLFLLNI